MPKISIIMPVYNASAFLEQSILSLKRQTLSDIEIICVNDGSKDDSLQIIRKYASKDARIKIIDKPNGGYGHSMNCGLSIARGKYIGILEPDDYIDINAFEKLYKNWYLSSLGGQNLSHHGNCGKKIDFSLTQGLVKAWKT